MSTPTPAATPDPNDTDIAGENAENPAEDQENEFSDQQGQDPDNVSPSQDASKDEEHDKLFDTDTGGSGA